jgi:hypothetical protein
LRSGERKTFESFTSPCCDPAKDSPSRRAAENFAWCHFQYCSSKCSLAMS